MNDAERAFYVSLGAAVGLLGLTCLWQGHLGLALAMLLLGAGWGAAHRLGWRWLSPLAFVALVTLAVGGLWLNLPAAWLVAGVAAALTTWDLDNFAAQLGRFEPRPDHAGLVKNHLGRLLIVTGVGLVLGEAALVTRLTLGLGVVVGLGVLAFIILTQAARLLGGDGA